MLNKKIIGKRFLILIIWIILNDSKYNVYSINNKYKNTMLPQACASDRPEGDAQKGAKHAY